MEVLTLHFTGRNSYPTKGLFVAGGKLHHWLEAIRQLGLSLPEVAALPVPGNTPGTFYGCILLPDDMPREVGSYPLCQLMDGKMFLPVHTDLSPSLTEEEWAQFFPGKYYFFDPENGLSLLCPALAWSSVLQFENADSVEVTAPSKPIRLPQRIESLALDLNEDTIENPFEKSVGMEEKAALIQALQSRNDKALAGFLAQLRSNPDAALAMALPIDQMGTSRGTRDGQYQNVGTGSGGSGSGGGFSGGGGFAGGGSTGLFDGLPLIVTIFLVIAGVIFVGGALALSGGAAAPVVIIVMLILRFLGSRSSSPRRTVSGNQTAVASSNALIELLEEYKRLAVEYEQKGEYEKAAYIYRKLLRDELAAAKILEKGRLFAEAGILYVRLGLKKEAIGCFEKAKMFRAVAKLYGEMLQPELAGDALVKAGDTVQANKWFEEAALQQMTYKRYLQAARIFEQKMHRIDRAREILLEGWENDVQPIDCLSHYYATLENPSVVESETNRLHILCNTDQKKHDFLRVLRTVNQTLSETPPLFKDKAYEIISVIGATRPDALNELKAFNPHDMRLPTEAFRYLLGQKAKKKADRP